MAFFGFRKYPTPVLKPMYPFLIGGAVTFYLVASAQRAMLQVPEYRDDPRNLHKKTAHH
ncbi:hypothetical protein P389DRAFT_160263 [Cystobasidium minutum MCA 4210]|uniref:uncharacterized protein n=1 Tax=Cystobasidium minutum MCA 4210 TaxID=1397322 RepID=UPI0034CF74DD|eukprot:jgi/Rhomi1/160263/estExt_Genewise1Plus.C_4_t10151